MSAYRLMNLQYSVSDSDKGIRDMELLFVQPTTSPSIISRLIKAELEPSDNLGFNTDEAGACYQDNAYVV